MRIQLGTRLGRRRGRYGAGRGRIEGGGWASAFRLGTSPAPADGFFGSCRATAASASTSPAAERAGRTGDPVDLPRRPIGSGGSSLPAAAPSDRRAPIGQALDVFRASVDDVAPFIQRRHGGDDQVWALEPRPTATCESSRDTAASRSTSIRLGSEGARGSVHASWAV